MGLIITQNNPLLNKGITDLNVIGNNPLAICAPGTPPFLFDGSLSAHVTPHSAVGLKEYADRNGILPPGIVQDVNGDASQDVNILYKILQGDRSSGSFPPLGGTKGLWLAMGMEFIAGALTGGFFENAPGKPWGEGAVIFAFDSKLFGSVNMIKQIQDYLKQFKTYPGYNSLEISNQIMSRGWIEYPKSQLESIIRVSNRSGINLNFESLR
ncbi:Ldh family oxidoreductase [Paenibacillus baimaensis]|uniref:Ldh family oxidoreductase n=1 Tax=Paenibacillus baimaensis TaxID=2982185 RepID=UPI00293F4F17|nr:Ldh family oxidoreductase [Paenibacillus sp. WQ 127069]